MIENNSLLILLRHNPHGVASSFETLASSRQSAARFALSSSG